MLEPAAKRAKTGEEEEQPQAQPMEGQEPAPQVPEEPKAPEPPKECEEDAPADAGRQSITNTVCFRVEDTTLNIMPSSVGDILSPLSEGGLQYLLAGARANVGIKSGRYMFEVKLVEMMSPTEDPSARQKTPMPRCQLRLGFSTEKASLFLGEAATGIAFDTDGSLLHNKNKKMQMALKFGRMDVLAVVLNLVSDHPNANTISLFKNGVRASPPQPLPEELVGKPLFPTLTFKNLRVHYNFGPAPEFPLPFTCHMVSQAALADAVVLPPASPPKDGKYEVVFPCCLPDEGGFDWLDDFLAKNPTHMEISDRSMVAWAESSGLWRPKNSFKTSNDKPELGIGISTMEDGTVRKVLQSVAPLQQRNFVIMELKSNLLKEDRKDTLAKWGGGRFKRLAIVMVGAPPAAVKTRVQELIRKDKQEAADTEFRTKKAEEKRKKIFEARQKQMEKERKKAEKLRAKQLEEQQKKFEEDRKKAEAEAKGEVYKPEEKEEEKKADEEEEEEEEAEEKEEVDDEEPPKVELTAEEKKLVHRKSLTPDLTPYILNTTFDKFSIPEKEDGFEEVKFEWSNATKSKEYLKGWILEKKLTTRVEDLQPSEWFSGQYAEWQKVLQTWHSKQNQYKAAEAKKAADKAAKEAAKAAKKAAKERKEAEAAAKKEAEAEGGEKKEGEEEEAEGGDKKEAPAMEVDEEEEEEEADKKEDEPKIDFENLDVFAAKDITDLADGLPLFWQFGFEDWTMMTLRFELHLLCHAFRRDVTDTDRVGIHVDNLPFYYNKYFKKALNTKFYGVETFKELLEYIWDTVTIDRKNQVLEPQLPSDMESMGIFVMLTEEARRERLLRVDLGDEKAVLKLVGPQGMQQANQKPGGQQQWYGGNRGPRGGGNRSPYNQAQQARPYNQRNWRPAPSWRG